MPGNVSRKVKYNDKDLENIQPGMPTCILIGILHDDTGTVGFRKTPAVGIPLSIRTRSTKAQHDEDEENTVMKPYRILWVLGVVVLQIYGHSVQAEWAAGIDNLPRENTLIVAKVGDNPKVDYPQLKVLADYLAEGMEKHGILGGDVKIAPDNQTLIGWLRRGKVDLVSETFFSAAYFHEQAGARVIALGWRKGVPKYHSIIFTHKQSNIERLDDLVGKVIAFEDPGSTTAYFLPAATLLWKGYPMARLMSVREPVGKTEIGYVFSGEEINSTTWVHKRLVDAAALSNVDWESQKAVPPKMKKDLQIIHRTQDYPRSVMLANALTLPDLIDRIAYKLHHAHEDPRGTAVIRKYKGTTRYEPVKRDMKETMATAVNLLKVVRNQLE